MRTGSSTSRFATPWSDVPCDLSARRRTKIETLPSARLREAFAVAGFEQVDFEMEPVAAAYAYESTLDHDELILIGDFGGGTSDFSLLRVGPEVRGADARRRTCLATAALALPAMPSTRGSFANSSRPHLGSDSEARSLNKLLPAVPAWIYANLERWHYLSFLRTNNVSEILKSARMRALEPEKIQALIALIDEDLGYQLHQAVQQVKFELSHAGMRNSVFATAAWTCAFPLRAATLNRGSKTNCRPSSDRSILCSRLQACIREKSTAYSLPGEARWFPQSAASS